jgi:hypothetical protein
MPDLTPRPDERGYEQLVETLRRQLPTEEWTDHNASDAGIMLLELLCWLAEMVQYRMERIPESHNDKFLNLLIDPPDPVTVDVRLRAVFAPAPAIGFVTVPAGTLVATDFVLGRRFVFETIQPLTLRRPAVTPPFDAADVVKARAILEVRDEALGTGNASPHQRLELRPPRAALGIDDAALAPILIDFTHRTGTYEPNPRVSVGAVQWTAVPSLRTEGSRVTTTNPARHFMVEPVESRIRFGDGVYGAMPPAGASIVCDRYAVLDGPRALSVREDEVRHLLNFAVPADVVLSIGNSDPEGGAHFFPSARRTEQGLAEFRSPYRLITEDDFERAVLVDFNAFQARAGRTERLVRASVVFDRRPPLDEDLDAPGYVTLVLLAGAPGFDEAQLRGESVTVAAKQALVGVSDALWLRLRRFLDPRRLITTRLVRHTPVLKPFSIAATVAVTGENNLAQVQRDLRERVYGFLSLVRGDFDGRGWRLGRSVYQSQMYRLLEDSRSVDHVVTLALAPADAQGNVPVGAHELPLLQSLALTVVRA